MILFVIDIFYLQFIRHFETNLTINLKKSRYIHNIYFSETNCLLREFHQKKSAYNNLFLFFGTTDFSLCQGRI